MHINLSPQIGTFYVCVRPSEHCIRIMFSIASKPLFWFCSSISGLSYHISESGFPFPNNVLGSRECLLVISVHHRHKTEMRSTFSCHPCLISSFIKPLQHSTPFLQSLDTFSQNCQQPVKRLRCKQVQHLCNTQQSVSIASSSPVASLSFLANSEARR